MKFKKGESGNPAGRPRKGNALTDVLNQVLDAKQDKKVKRFLLCEKIVDAGIGGDVQAVRIVFKYLQRDFEFSTTAEIDDRLDAIEKKLSELENAKIKN